MGLPLWLYIVILVPILIGTRSRGAIVAFIMAVSVLWMKKYVNPWIGGIVVYIVLALYVVSLSSGFTFTYAMEDLLSSETSLIAFLSRGQTAEELLSVSGRAELWHDVYALFLDRPILGYGYVGARSLLLQALPWAGHAHNALVETLLDSGVIGTALVWFALGKTLLSSLLQTPRPTGPVAWQQASILGVLLFLLFHSFVDPTFAGAPGYQTLLLFASVSAHGGLRPVVPSSVTCQAQKT